MDIRKVVIPAAGLGTRFLPATKAQPKEMLPIVDKPTIQYIVEEAVKSGIKEILIITGRNKRAIEDHFDKSVELEEELVRSGKEDMLKMVRGITNLVDIHYIRQKEARGLGHAIYCAHTFVGNEPFAVMLGDDIVCGEDPAIGQLMRVYERAGAPVLGVQRVAHSEVNKYGIVTPGEEEGGAVRVRGLVEKPDVDKAPSDMAVLGRYVITPDIFPILAQTQPGVGGEIQLTDALRVLSEQRAMLACVFQGKRYDVGNKEGYLQATLEIALQRDDLQDSLRAYIGELVRNPDFFPNGV